MQELSGSLGGKARSRSANRAMSTRPDPGVSAPWVHETSEAASGGHHIPDQRYRKYRW